MKLARMLAAFRLPARPRPDPAAATPPARPRRRRAEARRAVWTGAAALAALTAALAGALETKPEWRDPEYGHRLKQIRRWKEAAPGRPLVLVVGSSRTQMGVSPRDMGLPDGPSDPLVYNLGLMGATPVGIQYQLFRTLDAGVRPDFVVAELFVANAGFGPPAENQPWARPTRMTSADVGLLADYAVDRGAIPRRWAAARATAWSAHRMPLMSNWLPDWIPHLPIEQFRWMAMDDRGFNPFPIPEVPPELRDRMNNETRRTHLQAVADFRPARRSDEALRSIARRCRDEGIPVAFFRTPESPMFRTWYGPGSREKAEAYVAALARETGVPVFPPPELPEECFADGHHLIPAGATRFSRWLADNHLGPWLARARGTP